MLDLFFWLAVHVFGPVEESAGVRELSPLRAGREEEHEERLLRLVRRARHLGGIGTCLVMTTLVAGVLDDGLLGAAVGLGAGLVTAALTRLLTWPAQIVVERRLERELLDAGKSARALSVATPAAVAVRDETWSDGR